MYIYIYKNEENDDESGSVRPELFCKKVFKIWQNSKFVFLRKESLAQVFSCEFC